MYAPRSCASGNSKELMLKFWIYGGPILRCAFINPNGHIRLILNGRRYCLTCLGFRLSVVPMIMQALMRATLSQDPVIKLVTLSYIDDMYINGGVASADKVKKHLENYGLTCKAPEQLKDGAGVLVLHIQNNRGTLDWKWGSDVLEIPPSITRRAVLSMSGKLVVHFPVCRWLHIAASFIKCCVTTVVWLGRQDSGCSLERDDNRHDGQSTPEWPSARKVLCEQNQICQIGGHKLFGY